MSNRIEPARRRQSQGINSSVIRSNFQPSLKSASSPTHVELVRPVEVQPQTFRRHFVISFIKLGNKVGTFRVAVPLGDVDDLLLVLGVGKVDAVPAFTASVLARIINGTPKRRWEVASGGERGKEQTTEGRKEGGLGESPRPSHDF